ncbi:MAG TPA: hypothetical protein DHW85_02075 [Lachnospiraceae bacterium]|jgi:tetratricopeptide (TPR) repeat protein|nr:hypothetical protein [Lachnospiraceae bacterium]
MSVKYTVLSLKGTKLPKENPLPFYKDRNRNRKVNIQESLRKEDNSLLGYETAPRFLPYKIQDRYDRDRSVVTYKAIIMENNVLKATFLPEYGGRLYSLYHKKLEKDLLFTNPVIQPANLAVLNAWISGGVEWNVGQYGHSFTTSLPVFCGVLKDKNGEEFLRIYEYERCHNLFWHLDFHLPEDSTTLNMYARIVNDQDTVTSIYYWSNVAVKETRKARIFSGAEEVIYMDMKTREFGKGKMPYLPIMPEKDASYPADFSNSNEYFFQTPIEEKAPWEAVVYPDDWMFFERSSNLLRYRKMFCWGSHKGGQRWKDYLSEEGQGDYIEIQGGLAPTQLHGMILDANSTLEFVQCFGGIGLDTAGFYDKDWHKAKEKLYQRINETITEGYIKEQLKELSQYRDETPVNIVSFGSGFGALEVCRRKKQGEKAIPAGFCFPPCSLTGAQAPWLHLLDYGYMPETKAEILPEAYMIQEPWTKLLRSSLKHPNGRNWLTCLQLSVIEMEQGNYQESDTMAKDSITMSPNPLAYYNLALLAKQQKDREAFETYSKKALDLFTGDALVAASTQYFRYLLSMNEYEQIWIRYQKLPDWMKEDERLYLVAVAAAVKIDKLDFVKGAFEKKYVYVKEGETLISDLWFEYHLRLEEKKPEGSNSTMKEIKRLYPIPLRIDFRMEQDKD